MHEKKDFNTERLFVHIENAKKGDEDSLNRIFSYLDIPIKGMAKKYYLPGGDKDDVMQVARIGIYEGIKSFNKDKNSNPRVFLKLCAERNLKDMMKSMSRDKHKTLDVAYSLDAPLKGEKLSGKVLGDIIEDKISLDEIIGNMEFNRYLEKSYLTMGKLSRKVFKLYVKGYTYGEISKILSLNSKQVDNAITRAKVKLKKDGWMNELSQNA